jgi:NAD(P)-dependent dehydrogenase (short-subunit alcohol dehydrogenase family)
MHELFNLEDKVALVTGGSRGIGYIMAQGLLQAGAKVYITARTAGVCEKAAAELSQFGLCEWLPADINDPSAREQLVSRISDIDGKLDILINNAGTAWGDSFEDYPTEAFDKVLELNVTKRPDTVAGRSGKQEGSCASYQYRVDGRASYSASTWNRHLRIHGE